MLHVTTDASQNLTDDDSGLLDMEFEQRVATLPDEVSMSTQLD